MQNCTVILFLPCVYVLICCLSFDILSLEYINYKVAIKALDFNWLDLTRPTCIFD